MTPTTFERDRKEACRWTGELGLCVIFESVMRASGRGTYPDQPVYTMTYRETVDASLPQMGTLASLEWRDAVQAINGDEETRMDLEFRCAAIASEPGKSQ